MTLAGVLPAAVLADLLGISEGNAARWSELAGGDWASYAAHGADRYSPPPPRVRHTDGR